MLKSLLIRLEVSGSVLQGTSIAVLDKDHIAITGRLDSPDGKVRGNSMVGLEFGGNREGETPIVLELVNQALWRYVMHLKRHVLEKT